MPICVIDTSAVFADLNEEKGVEEARHWLRDAAISAVNLQEIVSKAVDQGVPAEEISELVTALRLDVRPLDDTLALAAGLMRDATKGVSLSHGNYACLALAQTLGLPAVTANRACADIADAVGVNVVLVR